MKIILCSVTLSVMGIAFVNGFGYSLPSAPKTSPERNCVQKTGATSEHMYQLFRIVPMTRTGKCLYECFMRSDGLLIEDGRINNDKFMTLLKTSLELDNDTLKKMETVMDICKNRKHPSNDNCDTVGLLLRCTTWEAEKRGFTTTYTLSLFCRFTGRC